MAITLNKKLFKTLCPEFATTPGSTLTLVSAEAVKEMNEDVWGDQADKGLVYLTAHMLKMAQRGSGGAGAVTQEKVGDLARSYAAPKEGGNAYEQTVYGREYQRLLNLLVTRPVVEDPQVLY